ncbi:unnamed protein product [Protopolystoma xenopodis]|uniref:Uncharacterized protein n=1 Tax=Protopolystoma xenopodis TaxID=117903 RepID=A0A3S5A4N4_9PLAT|nr:unnamed protein product [Protopolystoma xenopodis]
MAIFVEPNFGYVRPNQETGLALIYPESLAQCQSSSPSFEAIASDQQAELGQKSRQRLNEAPNDVTD